MTWDYTSYYHRIRCRMFTFYNTQKANTPFTTAIYRGRSPYSLLEQFDLRLALLQFIALPDRVVQNCHDTPKDVANCLRSSKIYICPTINTLSVAISTEMSEQIRRQISSELHKTSSSTFLINKSQTTSSPTILIPMIKYLRNNTAI